MPNMTLKIGFRKNVVAPNLNYIINDQHGTENWLLYRKKCNRSYSKNKEVKA